MTTRTVTLWSAYVTHLAGSRTQEEVAALVGTNQTTIGRWLRGTKVPTDAATVAHVSRSCGRNPLEGFVAAGMLDEDEAGRGLDSESRDLLAGLRSLAHG